MLRPSYARLTELISSLRGKQGKPVLAQSAALWEDSGFSAWGVYQLEGELVLPFLNRPPPCPRLHEGSALAGVSSCVQRLVGAGSRCPRFMRGGNRGSVWLFMGGREGVHPVLMGSEVTQPPGILLHPVTPPGSYLSVPKPAPVLLVTVSAWEQRVSSPESGSGVFPLPPLGAVSPPGLPGPLPCPAALGLLDAVSLGWGLRSWISNAFPGAAEGGLHFEKLSSRWVPFSRAVID